MYEDINKIKEITTNIEDKLLSIKGFKKFDGASLLKQYNQLTTEEKRRIAKEEILRYLAALNTLEGMDEDRRQQEMSHGVYEIIHDAEANRRARHDLSKLELSKSLTKTEQENFSKNYEKEEREAIEEKNKEEKIMKKIKEKFRRFFERNKGEERSGI